MNEIGNKLYKISTMKYTDSFSRNTIGVDITICSYEIEKETPKYYFLRCKKLSTYSFGDNIVRVSDYGTSRYKKDLVSIKGVETKNNLIKDLEEAIEIIRKDDDISNNRKKEYEISYEKIIEYLDERDF